MAIIFVIPMFFSLRYVLKWRLDLALLNVYLPCLLLLPAYYSIRIPHLPPASAAEWALLPLGVAALVRPVPPLKLCRMDIWVILFLLSFGLSEALRESSPKDGLTFFASIFVQMFFSYVVGRRVIEPDLRRATTKRFVVLFVCLAPAILMEFGTAQNLWLILARHLGVESGWFVYVRGGHPRVTACFGHAILAGVLFFIALMFDSWLADIYKRDKTALGPTFSRLERYHAPGILLILFVLATGSRGPLICCFIGISIVQIPKFRNFKLAAAAVALLLIAGGSVVHVYMDNYANASSNGQLDEQQTSAIYRKNLLENYKPVLEAGGWLGWGALSHPQVAHQDSIDNTYLLTQLSEGKLGLYLFLTIAAESIVSALQKAFTFKSRENRFFAFSFVAVLIGLFVSLYTVYMGEQLIPVTFFLLGWSQSLGDSKRETIGEQAISRHSIRVFT